MLVYEKKVNGERHLFGTVNKTAPGETDVQLTYKDTDGTVIEPELSDVYLNDGHGGIIRKSDGEAINVFIGETQIIGGDIPTPQMVSITVTPPTKTSYVEGDTLDLTGMTVVGNLNNGETIAITEDYSASPANGATLTTSNNKVVVTYFELTDEFTITVEAAAEPQIEITGIEVTTPPTKTVYTEGEALDLTGMVVTIFGTVDGEAVTELAAYNEYVTTPVEGAILTTDPTGEIEVVVSAYDFEDSFTVTVNAA